MSTSEKLPVIPALRPNGFALILIGGALLVDRQGKHLLFSLLVRAQCRQFLNEVDGCHYHINSTKFCGHLQRKLHIKRIAFATGSIITNKYKKDLNNLV